MTIKITINIDGEDQAPIEIPISRDDLHSLEVINSVHPIHHPGERSKQPPTMSIGLLVGDYLKACVSHRPTEKYLTKEAAEDTLMLYNKPDHPDYD